MMKKTNALMITSAIFAIILGLSACAPAEPALSKKAPQQQTPKEEVPPAGTKKQTRCDVLSRHDTNAVFAGTREHVCMGRSMLCPDRCGHSGTLATFKIESYNTYEKPGKYGDPKTNEFSVMLRSTTEQNGVSADIAQKISALKPGDKVHLVWEHIYVTDDTGAFPERVIRTLEATTK